MLCIPCCQADLCRLQVIVLPAHQKHLVFTDVLVLVGYVGNKLTEELRLTLVRTDWDKRQTCANIALLYSTRAA